MKLIPTEVEELKQCDNMFKHIELCGRTCYKSEDKITEDSYYKFVDMLKKHAHGAMLEHGTVYLIVPKYSSNKDISYEYSTLIRNPYSKIKYVVDKDTNIGIAYITTNYRVIVENKLEEFMLKYCSKCTEHHYKRRTFKITCNRGVSHEFVRHRVFSFAQESQRYVNYSKDKFGNEIKVIEPTALSFSSPENLDSYITWRKSCENAEKDYFYLLEHGATPQEARDVLPNATATELIMTGFESDWEHFFELRCAKDAHPQAQQVASKIKEIF